VQPDLPDRLPDWHALLVGLNSPFSMTGALLPVALDIAWLVWLWTAASIALEVVVNLLEAATRGATWVASLRTATDWLVIPPIRRAVDASLGGLMLTRVLVQPATAAEASALPVASLVSFAAPPSAAGGAAANVFNAPPRAGQSRAEIMGLGGSVQQESGVTSDSTLELIYTVQRGDTLWALGDRFYGDAPGGAERIFEANQGRRQIDGRVFDRRGLIFVGWTLRIPDPSRGIEHMNDGTWWYTVQRGDTLSEISARLLGDPNQWRDIFEMNRGTRAPSGHVLVDPNIIWPGLRLRLPLGADVSPPEEPPAGTDPAPAAAVPPSVADQPDRRQIAMPTPSPVPPAAAATEQQLSAPTPTPESTEARPAVASPSDALTPELHPVTQTPSESDHPLQPAEAALGAAALAAAVMAGGSLVVRKRRPWREPPGPESDVAIQNGFADVDPVADLSRRLARTSDPAAAVASLLGQAYAAIFDEVLQPDERREIHEVRVAGTRHGRTSTTVVIAAPVAARPFLVVHMRAAAERAFGEQVDVDGLVDQNGDVLVRVTWNPRRPIDGNLLERVGAAEVPSTWPPPCLVPVLVQYDRQHFAINWYEVANVLIASPTGQGAEVPLAALAAALASVRAPADLGLVIVARPHMLPDEVSLFPHTLLDVADPADPDAVQQALESVKLEIERRRESGGANEPELVVLLRELGDLEPEAMDLCGTIAATGPAHRVRIVAASEQGVPDLHEDCRFLDLFTTRLVLQTASEEDSVGLLGTVEAEDLSAGGHALLRFEGRRPWPGCVPRVSAERLAQLLHLMGSRVREVDVAEAAVPKAGEPEPDEQDVVPPADVDQQEGGRAKPAPSRRVVKSLRSQPLLDELRSAPVRVRCFGTREIWHGNRLLEMSDSRRLQLLLLLAAHPVSGIRNELLVEMLWAKRPADPAAALRLVRFELRDELRQLIPEIGSGDPVPGSQFHDEKVVILDPRLVSSDVHEFCELLRLAPNLSPGEAIEAYEAALSLYTGDLLDSPTVPSYRWLYEEEPQVAYTLGSDLRRAHKEARLRLAELLAAGPEAGLARAEELYWGLCAEDLDNERLWIALFRIHERTGSSVSLGIVVRRYQTAQIELGNTDVTDPDKVPLPPNLKRIVRDIQQRIGGENTRDD
jgi:nucleoid-associated protein YgaU